MAKKQDNSTSSESARFWRYVLVCVLMGVLALAWLSMLTYDPSDTSSPNNAPPMPRYHNAAGVVGSYLAYELRYWIGYGSYVALLGLSIAGVVMMLGRTIKDLSWRAAGLVILIIAVSAAAYMLDPDRGRGDPNNNSCGILGIGVGAWILGTFHVVGGWFVMAFVLGIGLMLTADNIVMRLPGAIGKAAQKAGEALPAAVAVLRPKGDADEDEKKAAKPAPKSEKTPADPKPAKADADAPAVVVAPKKADDKTLDAKGETKKIDKRPDSGKPWIVPTSPVPTVPSVTPNAAQVPGAPNIPYAPPSVPQTSAVAPGAGAVPSVVPSTPAAPSATPVRSPGTALPGQAAPARPIIGETPAAQTTVTQISAPAPRKDDKPPVQLKLPLTTLLAEPSGGYLASQEAQAEQKRTILQQALVDFQVEAQVVGHMTGPVITMFELSLAPGVKVSQVVNLAPDIARALAVPGVRVVSPLPNKDTIGIEVPNLQKEIVRIRELMNMVPNADKKMALPLYLGKDASGGAIVADLAKMPHMLIAGTTGSGKSVCINSIVMSLLLTRTPEDLRFILVDPKMVEMAAFENIQYLLCPVVNDMKRAEDILEWAATKMDERYELLKEAMVKNIAQFNQLPPEEIYKRFQVESDDEKARIPTKLPYYVIIIDELADLIMTSSKEVEGHIIRIAQKARAVGIHLILATQRPSVNVVTGLIKSNMPCRISFKVASRQESRIVLDSNGAEVLLGQGDMLFLQPGSSNLMRAQGTFVDDSEIHGVIEQIRQLGEPQYNSEVMKVGSADIDGDGAGERDELFEKAVEIVLQSQRGSVSLLQRRLQIGYSRSSRIIDQMAQAGFLGDYKGSQARECLMTLEDWHTLKASITADQTGQSSLDGEPTSS